MALVLGVMLGVSVILGAPAHADDDGNLAGNPGNPDNDAPTVDVAEPDATPEPEYGIWDQLARCESTSDWHSSSNPIYKGGLQFDSRTWARYGGLTYAWRADFASRAQQILIAERTLAAQGWSAWPVCSRRLGFR